MTSHTHDSEHASTPSLPSAGGEQVRPGHPRFTEFTQSWNVGVVFGLVVTLHKQLGHRNTNTLYYNLSASIK